MTATHGKFWTIRNSLIGALLVFALSAALAFSHHRGWIAQATAERGWGVSMGLLLVVVGNFIPKTLEPLARNRAADGKVQALQRFSGWAFVLGGVAYAAIWLVAPIEYANHASTALLATVVVVVVARAVWTLKGHANDAPPRGGNDTGAVVAND